MNADKGFRRRTYVTALEQAEALWVAAERVGTVSRPILQYYSLFQVALAVAAGSPLGNGEWQPKQGHGLKTRLSRTSATDEPGLDDITVEAAGEGMAQKLAQALQSPLLKSPCTLQTLIASLPNQRLFLPLDSHSEPLCIHLTRPRTPQNAFTLARVTDSAPSIDLWPLPGDFPRSIGPAVTLDGAALRLPGPSWGDLRDLARTYPDLRTIPRAASMQTIWTMAEEHGASILRLQYRAGDSLDGHLLQARLYTDTEILAMPLVGANEEPQHPLVTWFAILHALSILARYHPATWRRMLDLEESRHAVDRSQFISEGTLEAVFVAGRTLSMLSLEAKSRHGGEPSTSQPNENGSQEEPEIRRWFEGVLADVRARDNLVQLAAEKGYEEFIEDPELLGLVSDALRTFDTERAGGSEEWTSFLMEAVYRALRADRLSAITPTDWVDQP